MITEWTLSMVFGVVGWFSDLLPQDDPPAFLADVGVFLAELIESASGLGAWVPWVYLGSVGSALLLLWVVLVTVKGIRWLWGLTPLSGGS